MMQNHWRPTDRVMRIRRRAGDKATIHQVLREVVTSGTVQDVRPTSNRDLLSDHGAVANNCSAVNETPFSLYPNLVPLSISALAGTDTLKRR
jgi:hypothetical protein